MAVDTISYAMVGVFGADNNELVFRYSTWGFLSDIPHVLESGIAIGMTLAI